MFYKVTKDKALMQVVIYVMLVFLFLIENNTIIGRYKIYSRIDNLIPFVPIFVIPYFAWFLFILITGIIFLKRSKEDLRKTFFSINLIMIIALIIYIIFPNYQLLRPAVYADDFFSQLVKFLQIDDSPSCVCPSLHVSICISLYLSISNSICFKNNCAVKLFTLILTILICISTVFIKQHSIIDVAAGILLSVLVYTFVYKIYFNNNLFTSDLNREHKNRERLGA